MTGRFPPVPLPGLPFATEAQAFCRGLEGAWEDYPWGNVVFKVGAKMFAGLGGTDHLSLTVKARPEDADVLCQLPFISQARYLGRYGWVTIAVTDDDSFALARELVQGSYELVGPRRGQKPQPA